MSQKIIIPEKYIDIDFTTQSEFVFGDRGMPFAGANLADYEETLGIIDPSEYKDRVAEMEKTDTGIEFLIKQILDQGREGSCVSNATAQAMMMICAFQHGIESTPMLSPISLYKRVARSASSGSMLSDNVEEAMSVGVLPLDNEVNRKQFKHVMSATGFNNKFPQGWGETAAKIKLGEVYVCRSVNAVISATLRRHPVLVGRQGHSIVYLRPTYSSNTLLMIYVNSWSKNWGFKLGNFEGGFGADRGTTISQASNWAVAFRTVEMEPLKI